tara:strand:+ start:93 stop:386 length:294 start_codon:yes stop_codon:yes gene_type:complete
MVLIYKLFSNSCDSFYIGSTARTLKYRLAKHRNKSYEAPERKVYKHILETGGFKEWHMELIETIDSTDDVVRRQREQFWIDELKPDLNDRGAFRIKL